jgi:hypothetical protein
MSPASTELYERYEQFDEGLARTHATFTRRVVELECARKYGDASRIDEALDLLDSAAQIYMRRLMEHVEHVVTYVAQELRDPIVL